MGGHSEGERVGVVESHFQRGAGAPEFLGALALQDVAHADSETIHGEGRGGVQGNQGAALLYEVPDGVDPLSLIAQVYDLSQVNFRGFNGASKPVSLLYSEAIALVLSGKFRIEGRRVIAS